jgi:hypothetical protein
MILLFICNRGGAFMHFVREGVLMIIFVHLSWLCFYPFCGEGCVIIVLHYLSQRWYVYPF